MELFYSSDISDGRLYLDGEESQHCIKVLRHRTGDEIAVTDGTGNLMKCRLTDDSAKRAGAVILDIIPDWGGHPYDLEMAVCSTKNIDRYEWFAEKACETGIDSICPVIGEHSERKILKIQRIRKILLSAAKQSLKGKIPDICDALPVKDYILQRKESSDRLKLIAYCFEDEQYPRISVKDALNDMPEGCRAVSVLIGPEGDFSPEEASMAVECGFIPVHLGPSRLRTETAALAAVFAVYSHFML